MKRCTTETKRARNIKGIHFCVPKNCPSMKCEGMHVLLLQMLAGKLHAPHNRNTKFPATIKCQTSNKECQRFKFTSHVFTFNFGFFHYYMLLVRKCKMHQIRGFFQKSLQILSLNSFLDHSLVFPSSFLPLFPLFHSPTPRTKMSAISVKIYIQTRNVIAPPEKKNNLLGDYIHGTAPSLVPQNTNWEEMEEDQMEPERDSNINIQHFNCFEWNHTCSIQQKTNPKITLLPQGIQFGTEHVKNGIQLFCSRYLPHHQVSFPRQQWPCQNTFQHLRLSREEHRGTDRFFGICENQPLIQCGISTLQLFPR